MAKSAARKRLNIWRVPLPSKRGNSFQLLNRLIGIETEYGLYRGNVNRVDKLTSDESTESSFDESKSRLPSSFSAYQFYSQFVPWLSKRLPTAASSNDPYRIFLANGGCVGIEPGCLNSLSDGLIEAATPECRSPLELVAYQSVQDRWMTESLRDIHPQTDARWLKNSIDSLGVSYGQHENYEVRIASGWRLAFWRLGIAMMLPQLIIYRIQAAIWNLIVILLRMLVTRLKHRSRSKPAVALPESIIEQTISQPDLSEGIGRSIHMMSEADRYWILCVAKGLRYLHWPIAMYFNILIHLCVLVPHRRWLSGFLASRAVLDGSGHVDSRGCFWLSSRVSKINAEIGFGQYWNERPIFLTGHWLKSLLADRSWTFQSLRSLLGSTQRIQIAIGDSTPNDRSQYLRVGTTSLIMDLIELGQINNLPRLKNNLHAFKMIATDSSLMRTVADHRGIVWTAIDLQRQYAGAVRAMLTQAAAQQTAASKQFNSKLDEARAVLSAWQETLDHLQESESDPISQRWLLGRVDWFSKRWLMDRSPPKTSWNALKKIDLKFHEMDERGYFSQLVRALDIPSLFESGMTERASRMPPSNSPAMKRAYFIREFSADFPDFAVDWNSISWTGDDGKRVSVSCF